MKERQEHRELVQELGDESAVRKHLNLYLSFHLEDAWKKVDMACADRRVGFRLLFFRAGLLLFYCFWLVVVSITLPVWKGNSKCRFYHSMIYILVVIKRF